MAKVLFDFFYNYKVHWKKRGYETPLVDKVILGKIRSLVGGKLRFMAVGSAPLAPETHEFIRSILCCPVVIGYAMTETSCCGALGVGEIIFSPDSKKLICIIDHINNFNF